MARKRLTKRETRWRVDLPRSDVRLVLYLYGNPMDLSEPERVAVFAVVDALVALEAVGRLATPASLEDAPA